MNPRRKPRAIVVSKDIKRVTETVYVNGRIRINVVTAKGPRTVEVKPRG